MQAACVAQQTPGILCLKSKQKLIDAKRLCSEMSETIIPLHVINDVITTLDSTWQVRS